jgi:hypothetical protein
MRENYTDVWYNRGIVPAELDQLPESGNEGKLTKPDSGTYSSRGSIHPFFSVFTGGLQDRNILEPCA